MLITLFAISLVLNIALLVWLRRQALHGRESMRLSRDAAEKHGLEIEKASAVRDRMLSVLESMTEGVVVIDSDKKILLMNSVLAGFLEADPHSAKGSYFWEMFRDPDVNEMLQKALDTQSSIRREHKILLFDTHFEIQVSPVFSQDRFLGIVAVFHDVTRLKKLEEMRAEFVANVSHELKTPLTSILGYVETLKEGAAEDKKDRDRFLDIIEDHAKELHTLIEDLLLLSSVESGRTQIHKSPVTLSALLDRAQVAFDKRLKDKKITLERAFDPKTSVFQADPKRIEQAISNLIDNAVKYNVPGGRITVGFDKEGDSVRIRVSDTGIGIPETDLPRIFERFYRVDKSRSRESGGSGLGLSIVKHIVERHNGRVDVESRPGKGTTFSVVLPLGL